MTWRLWTAVPYSPPADSGAIRCGGYGPAKPVCQFIGLNPSTADEVEPDPTVTRCISFAKAWGYGGLVMTNIFAWRATAPEAMKAVPFPVGEINDLQIYEVAIRAGITVAAWGNHGAYRGRDQEVMRLLAGLPLHYLRLTRQGQPWHPLYLPGDLKPVLWEMT